MAQEVFYHYVDSQSVSAQICQQVKKETAIIVEGNDGCSLTMPWVGWINMPDQKALYKNHSISRSEIIKDLPQGSDKTWEKFYGGHEWTQLMGGSGKYHDVYYYHTYPANCGIVYPDSPTLPYVTYAVNGKVHTINGK